MESHEWRARQLENKLPGPIDLDQLLQVANAYGNFIDANGEKYGKFLKLREEIRDILFNLTGENVNDLTKAELVLAYEDDLIRHLESVKSLAKKADQVLDVKRWPDLTGFEKRLEKLETITRDQHLQSVALDSQTEELIEVYNDIISSFKKNSITWNQTLEAHEMAEKKLDEDE